MTPVCGGYFGVICGHQERHHDAHKAFRTALDLEGSELDIANIIVSLFALGHNDVALEAINTGFEFFCEGAQKICEAAIVEAINREQITFMEIGYEAQIFMKRSGSTRLLR